jgi:hypothetical protein
MDTRLARVVYTLSIAAKLKKNNPETSDVFIQKNPSYFPNKTDRLVEIPNEQSVENSKEEKNKNGGHISKALTEGSADPAKNIFMKKQRIQKKKEEKEQKQKDLENQLKLEQSRTDRTSEPNIQNSQKEQVKNQFFQRETLDMKRGPIGVPTFVDINYEQNIKKYQQEQWKQQSQGPYQGPYQAQGPQGPFQQRNDPRNDSRSLQQTYQGPQVKFHH